MRVLLKETSNHEPIEADIIEAIRLDLPFKKDGWQFSWHKLSKQEGAILYELSPCKQPNKVEGMLMLSLVDQEMLYMNNIEVAPHNYGSTGLYENVVACLLAYACYKSFELGKNNYVGYLVFDSKTQLIELYKNKYGATHARGQKMFFDPDAGRVLIQKYLLTDLH